MLHTNYAAYCSQPVQNHTNFIVELFHTVVEEETKIVQQYIFFLHCLDHNTISVVKNTSMSHSSFRFLTRITEIVYLEQSN